MRKDMKDVVVNCTRGPRDWKGTDGRKNKAKFKADVRALKDMKTSELEEIDLEPPRLVKTKDFGDRLMPMRRWLKKQVGRYWDDVFSELCESAPRKSVRGWHLRQHVIREVTTVIIMDDAGNPRDPKYGYKLEDELYVDADGILRFKERKNLDAESKRRTPSAALPLVINKKKYFVENGCWFELKTVECEIRILDVVSMTWRVTKSTRMQQTQLNRQELREIGLRNYNQ